MVAALILAAGAGVRYGGPKALALHDGAPFLEHVSRACLAAGCDPVVAVVAADAPAVSALARELNLKTVVNHDPARGMFSSVQVGLVEALGTGASGVVIFPVDHPQVQSSTLRAVMAKCAPDAWVVPRYEARRGHPVVLGSRVARALLSADPDQTLREALKALETQRVDVAVDDPGILRNVNTREDGS